MWRNLSHVILRPEWWTQCWTLESKLIQETAIHLTYPACQGVILSKPKRTNRYPCVLKIGQRDSKNRSMGSWYTVALQIPNLNHPFWLHTVPNAFKGGWEEGGFNYTLELDKENQVEFYEQIIGIYHGIHHRYTHEVFYGYIPWNSVFHILNHRMKSVHNHFKSLLIKGHVQTDRQKKLKLGTHTIDSIGL